MLEPMAGVLYRKYRSQTFDELIGQGHITDILKNAVRTGSISHAYLFVGSRGTGKTSTARILAKAINCTNLSPEGNPCNECEACVAIAKDAFLDLIEIDAASNRGIDQIRELKERIEFAPSEGKYKIYIIDEVHMLTTEAFNALLKTLEEPPKHVVFILATTDVHKLPATILSRCQRYDFRLGGGDQVKSVIETAARNEGVKLSEGALKILTENARGSYRDALSLLDVVVSGQLESDKPEEVSENEVRTILGIPDSTMVYYLLEKLVTRQSADALKLIDELDSRGVNLQQFVSYVLLMLREILVQKVSGTLDTQEFSFAEKLSISDLIQLINMFIDAERKLKSASIPALVLELIIAKYSSESLTSSVSETPVPKRSGQNNSATSVVSTSTPKTPKTNKETKSKASKSDSDEVSSKVEEGQANVQDPPAQQETQAQTENTSEASNASNKPEEASAAETSQGRKEAADKTDLTVDQVKADWDRLIETVKKHNGHLHAFLKTAQIEGIEDGRLVLQVPFQFHKDRIESHQSIDPLSKSFNEVFGSGIAVRCKVNADIKPRNKVSADVILKNIPQSPPPKPKEEASAQSAQVARRPNKQIEEIFAGM